MKFWIVYFAVVFAAFLGMVLFIGGYSSDNKIKAAFDRGSIHYKSVRDWR